MSTGFTDIDDLLGVNLPAPMAVADSPFDATQFSPEAAIWAPHISSPDNDLYGVRDELNDKAQDRLYNDAYVAGGAALHQNYIVGAMYLLNCKPNIGALGRVFDETWEEEFQTEVESKFMLAAESPDNWLDASGLGNLTEMTRLAVGCQVACGEILASAEWIREAGRPFNTAVQMLDVSRLCDPQDRIVFDRDKIRDGVERDARGKPVAYYIRMAHRDDWANPDAYRWRRVEARKPWGRRQILHFYDRARPDQSRGVTMMVAALKELRITKQFDDVTLQQAVLAATYAASIESEMPTEAVFARLGAGDLADQEKITAAITAYGGAYLANVSKYSDASKNIRMAGVKIPHFFPGTKLNIRQPTAGGPGHAEFKKSLLRYIAANLGVSYEQLSKDYSETNYSSAKAGLEETRKFMSARKKLGADKFATGIFRLWLEEAINKGQIDSIPRAMRKRGWIYEGLNFDAIATCDWIGASRGQIDELKETQAAGMRMKFGLTTREIELGRLGLDWRTVDRQEARERANRERLNLPPIIAEDNALNAASGAPREKEAADE